MKIKGIMTGDFECWCLAVDRATFIKVKGKKPDQFDQATFYLGKKFKYKLYPSDLFGRSKDPIELTFEVAETEEVVGDSQEINQSS